MLGFGATGEVWVARDDVSGEAVALKRLRAGSSLPADRERLRREGAILAAFRHPNVIGLRGVLGDAEGLVLVLDLASGGSLASVLAGLGRLRAGEAVAFLAPVADALAAAHGHGLLHGDVSPGNLLLAADGTPLLTDLGTARLVGDERSPVHATSRYLDPAVRAGGAPTAASDVYSLAAVAAHALTAQPVADHAGAVQEWAERGHELGVSAPLVAALCGALAADPRRRPSAGELGTALRAACLAEPLGRLVAAARAGAESVGGPEDLVPDGVVAVGPDSLTRPVRRRLPQAAPVVPGWWARWRQRLGSGVSGRVARAAARVRAGLRESPAAVRTASIVTLVVVAGLGGVGWAASGAPEPAAPGLAARSPSPDMSATPDPKAAVTKAEREWKAVVQGLDTRRGEALARAREELLFRVYTLGSAPLAGDTQAIRSLVAAGATAPGVRHEVTAVRLLSATGRHARLVVTDRMPAYRVVARSGAVLRVVPARASKTFQLELVRTVGGWRIQSIVPAR